MRDFLTEETELDLRNDIVDMLELSEDEEGSLALLPTVGKLLARAKKRCRELTAERGERSTKGYLRWVDEQLRQGAGALHRLCKPQDMAVDKVQVDAEGNWGSRSRTP